MGSVRPDLRSALERGVRPKGIKGRPWLRARMTYAKELLDRGATVPEAAEGALYESVVTFQRTYQRYWGRGPTSGYGVPEAPDWHDLPDDQALRLSWDVIPYEDDRRAQLAADLGGLMYHEIGLLMGISKQRVEQIEDSALRKLRRKYPGLAEALEGL